jgi:hypothetical protein
MAVAIRGAILAAVHDPKTSSNSDVRSAYQISRSIRNAFTHAPSDPIWSIDDDCKNQTFAVRDIIKLDTTNLHGQRFDWRHYGGPLALLRLSQFVRIEILGDTARAPFVMPTPQNVCYQQGDLIIQKVDSIPPAAVKVQ